MLIQKKILIFSIFIIFVNLLFINISFGFELEYSLSLTNRFTYQANYLSNGSTSLTGFENPKDIVKNNVESALIPLDLRFINNDTYYGAYAGFFSYVELVKNFGVIVNLDSGELRFDDGYTFYGKAKDTEYYYPEDDQSDENGYISIPVSETELEKSYYFRELYTEIFFGKKSWLQIKAGKQLFVSGNSFIVNDYGLGAAISANFESGFDFPLSLDLFGCYTDSSFTSDGKDSPFFNAELKYFMSAFEEIGLFFSYFHDGDNQLGNMLWAPTVTAIGLTSAAQIKSKLFRQNEAETLKQVLDLLALNQSVNDLDISSNADIYWLGMHGNRFFSDFSINVTGIIQWGSMRIKTLLLQ